MFNNEFVCSDGHTFNANAKSRSRCPECGKPSRRVFAKEPANPSESVTGGDSAPVASPPVNTTEPVKETIKLIRKGKPRVSTMPKRTTPPKGKDGKFLSSKKAASVKTSTNKLVKRHTVSASTKKPAMPKVRRPPKKTAIARHIAPEKNQSYADMMMEQYGIGRRH